VGPLDRANLHHWTLLSPEDGDRASLWNVVILLNWTMDNVRINKIQESKNNGFKIFISPFLVLHFKRNSSSAVVHCIMLITRAVDSVLNIQLSFMTLKRFYGHRNVDLR
jgi:hypothetical protein